MTQSVKSSNVKTIDSEILEFIKTSQWCFAKTMPQCPHEYIVRKWRPDKELVFECFVMVIRERGYDARFLDATYRYLEIDGWKYWTMGAALNETTIINRAKVEAKTGDAESGD
jgi:hypothetical protein